MKLISLFFCLLIAVSARAASPAFSDFNLNQFGTNATAGNKVQIKSGSLQSNNVFWSSSSAIQMKGSDGTIGASFNTGTNFFAMVLREDKSLIVSSNTLANLPTLLKGDMAFWSSNGVPYLITCAPNGTLATNALLSSGSFTGDANQFTTSGTTHISDGAIVSNVVDHVTLRVTNVFAGGYMTISNISVSYHNSSDVLGDFIFFDSGLAILGNGAIRAGGGYMSVSNGTISGITLLGSSNIFQVLGIGGTKSLEVSSNGDVYMSGSLHIGGSGGGNPNWIQTGYISASNFFSYASNSFGYVVAKGYAATTNLAGTAPNLTNSISVLTTNASFLWLAPINFDAGQFDYQQCSILVTNSAASGIVMTLPANWLFSVGSTNGVNAGGINKVVFECYPNVRSNVTSVQWK